MNDTERDQLVSQMVIEVITMELADKMMPVCEGRERARSLQQQKTQDYLNVRHWMLQAVIALESLGHSIEKQVIDDFIKFLERPCSDDTKWWCYDEWLETQRELYLEMKYGEKSDEQSP